MFDKQTEGSVVCPSCGRLVGVNDEVCYNCGRRNPGMWGYAKSFQILGRDLGLLPFVLYGSILMYLITLAYDPRGITAGGMFSFLAPSPKSNFVFGSSGYIPVFVLDRWWTVLSASFLHGGLLHIGLNLYWVRMLIPSVSDIYGASRTVIIFTSASVVGFIASSFMGRFPIPVIGGAPLTVGASAAIFGLFGALIGSGGAVGQQAKFYAVIFVVMGFVFPGIDNWAHLGGLAGGYLAARALNPHRVRETPGLLFAALGCMAAFVLSLIGSFLHSQASREVQTFIAIYLTR